jgi:hypothetical protein
LNSKYILLQFKPNIFVNVCIFIKCEAQNLHRKQRARGRNIFCLQSIIYQKHETSLALNNDLEIQLNIYEGKERENAVEDIYPGAHPEGVYRSRNIAPPTQSRYWTEVGT